MVTEAKKMEILEATKGLDLESAKMVARAMGNDDAVQEKIQKYKDEVEALRHTLYRIQEYGSRNPGCGFSCATKARDGLNDSNRRLP